MRHVHFTTDPIEPGHEFRHWSEIIADAYFNLQLNSPDADRFKGQLDLWDMDTIQLSKLASSGLSYRRLRQHCNVRDSEILVTIPLKSEVEFSQLGRITRCAPGQFILELSDEPYEFGYRPANVMWVLKVPAAALKARVGDATRFCARQYDRANGVGRLFSDYVELLIRHCSAKHSRNVFSLMGTQLLDLLAISLQNHPDATLSQLSVVRDAHLRRIEAYVRAHLAEPDLSPAQIAHACGISVRYLHELFRDTGDTMSRWILEQRLQAAREALARADRRESVTQIAFGVGFKGQAQFSRTFRAKFGQAPSELIKSVNAG